ncbi:glyoxylase-like metal-dependent hydrolase (beta-lactamase superfamily II) [Sporomusaceae bacterium BoRhaA]|uniref:N-acyl homoserine lactonase family protein n=1 Tax=Pelorhabdus rhamnosifermentans TaxID=2772457 RepID=UPI001C0646F8|nr:N-acyl homoserine lactonase family protein [Pelorhabdus rhamnosifermentans]MBU2703492.1 glyoxylase-like metal-dependent hydrolase (beta-lactamase superfamily II) [Pelorhabdus rhamnosifermentans]
MKLHILQTGYTKVPFGQFFGGLEGWAGLKGLIKFATDKKHYILVPINCFLIEHPIRGPILVDTGISWEQAREHSRYYTGVAKIVLDEDEYILEPEEQIPAQLRALGYECNDISTIILTHLHEDHIGGLKYFSHAKVIVSKIEWENRNKKFLGLVPQIYSKSILPIRNWQLVTYSSGAFYNFSKCEDIFGDNSLVMIPTPGHTTGHSSVFIQCGSYQVLLCGDILYTLRHLAVEQVRSIILQPELVQDYIESVQNIVGLHQLIPNLIVIPGHDPTEYQSKYLRLFFKDGALSEKELLQIKSYEKRIFNDSYTLIQGFIPKFVPSSDSSRIGKVY